jgi:hypothetical protein
MESFTNRKQIDDSFADQDLLNQPTPIANSIYALMQNSLAPNNHNNVPNRNILFDPSLEMISNNDFK